MKNVINIEYTKNKDIMFSRNEVNEKEETILAEGKDSWDLRQVATSSDTARETTNTITHVLTSGKQETTLMNATKQVTTRSDTTQELITTSTQDLTSSSRIRNFNNPILDYNTIQETITNNIMQTIHQMMEALTKNLKGLIQEEIKNTQKEETKQQQKHSHTNSKADQNTGTEIHRPSTSEVVQEDNKNMQIRNHGDK
ncbi:hypothetical protein L9F63_011687 [Diploptera punctata]|uniref:Uncharacterized protein n=1 Tax=Diploptera punctata TaxID=6984 RepID=A0AAD8AF50_DIPPU|nr:hypothetical protein L9F63_011687 [Diploptera punctata]